MLDDQDLQALADELTTAVGELAQLRKERQQLDSGDSAGADRLKAALDGCSTQILGLSLKLLSEAQVSDSDERAESIESLLQNVSALGADGRQSEMEHLWNAAFMVGLTTIAAAAVGAPLAALATNQVIGQKILEDAIVTFASVAIVEATLEVKNHMTKHREPIANPWGKKTPHEPVKQPSPVKSPASRAITNPWAKGIPPKPVEQSSPVSKKTPHEPVKQPSPVKSRASRAITNPWAKGIPPKPVEQSSPVKPPSSNARYLPERTPTLRPGKRTPGPRG